MKLPFLKPRHPSKPRGAPLVVLLVLTLALSTALAYEALDAARSHRATAESTLRDYAEIAAWEFTRRARDKVGYAVELALWPALQATPSERDELWLSAEDVAEKAWHKKCEDCPRVDHVEFYFKLDLETREVSTTKTETPEWFLGWLADTLCALSGEVVTGGEGDLAMLVGPISGRTNVIGYTFVADSSGKPHTAYGFRSKASGLHDVFRFWSGEKPLLPPAIAGAQPNDSLLFMTVSTSEGKTVFESPVEYAETYAVADTMGQRFGGMVVQAALRPQAASELVIGGLPRSRVPLLMALLVVTALVGVAALVQLRRERELAKMRDDFVSSVSHELRTPLAQIRMFAELLDLEKLRNDEERERSIRVINQEARRLTHLVENVLHFSRLRRGTARMSKDDVDVATLVKEITAAFEPLARASEVRLKVQVEPDIGALLDRDAIAQVVLNLLDNAVKYGPTGQTVTLRAALIGDRIRIAVEDQGPGIPMEDRGRVWEPYRRLERDVSAAVGGSGIGLSVVHELVALHGGTVTIEDAPGGGARVVVSIPGGRRRGGTGEWVAAKLPVEAKAEARA
jgi:signal transduction histidine kinase